MDLVKSDAENDEGSPRGDEIKVSKKRDDLKWQDKKMLSFSEKDA